MSEDEPDAEAMLRRFDAMLADAPAPALPGFARVAGQFDDAADDDGGDDPGFDDLPSCVFVSTTRERLGRSHFSLAARIDG